MLFHAVEFHAVLFQPVEFHAVEFHAVLFQAVLFQPVEFQAARFQAVEFQAVEFHGEFCQVALSPPVGLPAAATGSFRSGAEPLAATVAAGGDDAAAALGGHAGAETVPALADELGGLIGALHLFDTAECGPS